MIRECNVHGYFSDEPLCPACNDEGKFIMRSGERDSAHHEIVAGALTVTGFVIDDDDTRICNHLSASFRHS